MKDDEKWIKLKLKLQHGVKAEIKIMDGIAIMKFSKKGLAFQNYEAEKKLGNERAEYNEKYDLYFEKYQGWNVQKIAKKIMEECKGAVVKEDNL